MSATTPIAPELPTAEHVLGKAAHENFTVASLILGRERQQHLRAIYGFARLVDDVGDEASGDRAALLDEIDAQLDRVYAGRPARHPLIAALARSVYSCAFPQDPLRRLVQANRQDQTVTRYANFEELLAYCQLSAAPVGELVLYVFGAATPERVALSDRVCAGLQVTEHLQDITEDLGKGRIYMPREDLIASGCDPEDPLAGSAGSRHALITLEAGHARLLLGAGTPLLESLPLRPRLAVAGFVAGGRAALDELERTDGVAGSNQQRRRSAAFALTFLRTAAGR